VGEAKGKRVRKKNLKNSEKKKKKGGRKERWLGRAIDTSFEKRRRMAKKRGRRKGLVSARNAKYTR